MDSNVAKELLENLRSVMGDREDLAFQYRHLFVGPNKLAAPPYGSVYTDRDQVLFGETTLALRSWMRGEGVGVEGLDGAPEDHIATMLLLLSWLAANRPELLEEFLAEHLLTWAPHYLEQLKDAAGDGFYGVLARLTTQTLTGLRDELSVKVVEPKFYR